MTSECRKPEHWRSLEELAATEEFRPRLENEFPHGPWPDSISRRDALRLLGVSLALGGAAACARQPAEKIVPYVRPPEEVIPGRPLFFATAMTLGGFARGVLVESHMGRPTKVEGNPEHPDSLGATDAFAQASVLDLYDPDRSQAVMHRGRISSWVSFLAALGEAREAQILAKGAGLRILTGAITSPSLAAQLGELLRQFPAARWHQYEPAAADSARAGAELIFGEPVDTLYRFEKADVILSLDADFLTASPGSLAYARAWAARREPRAAPGMNRLYVVESAPSATGSVADHRLRLRCHEIAGFAREVARGLGVAAAGSGAGVSPHAGWIAALVRDLERHRGASAVVAGPYQPPEVHALAQVMNRALGNVGKTVLHVAPVQARPEDPVRSLRALVEDMQAGRVALLLVTSVNPVFSAPADVPFADALGRVKLSAHLGLYRDETAARTTWHIPEAHYLESWSDARAYDGTVTILQPLIAPLYQGRSALEIAATLAGKGQTSAHALVREYWKGRTRAGDFEAFWETALHDGSVPGTAAAPKQVEPRPDWRFPERAPEPVAGLELVFRPDPTVWDGSFANNGWLQELPKPLTKLTWSNAALLSPKTAERLALASGDEVELRYRGRVLRAPVWILPGHADDSVTLHLGYGRSRAGRFGNGRGSNAYALRTADEPWFGSGLEVARTGLRRKLACTQDHHALEGRNIVRAASFAEYERNPRFAHQGQEAELSLYPAIASPGYAWGMAVNLSSCTGCNACVAACNAENNIPVVGETEVERGRAMHWLRIDRYFAGDAADPKVYCQPMLCQHCEAAPCEVVCPVNATVHSSEGLNQMVYNRCIGTRYCSNNCPYKVRRFNFFEYADLDTPSLEGLRNPNVTVRGRGVMEKCSYCVQRIQAAKIEAEKEDRRVRDGEIRTACQAACPTEAIVFGDISDPSSRVARLKAEPRNYAVLGELGTRPRTTYLARLAHPNPEIERS